VIDFDDLAAKWDEDYQKTERAEIIAGAIRAAVPLNSETAVLDYGCGTGLLSFLMYEHVGEITLVDSSVKMLESVKDKITRHQIENMHPFLTDSLESLQSCKFGLIYSLMTLHHIEDVEAVVEKLAMMLHDNGHLCLADLLSEDGSFHGPDFVGHHGFEIDTMEEIISRVGLSVCSSSIVYSIKKTLNNMIREYPIFLITGRKGIG
jgi:2-polyprenyl-3-methyl-5-hydroxy-6-metoxy-1,4-benzoquinol methylase